MKSEITTVDYLWAIPIAVYFWCAQWFDRAERCEDSPDRTHFYIAKDMKKQCKWCGKIEEPKGK